MKNKNLKNKNDYKSIAYQINNKKKNTNKENIQNKAKKVNAKNQYELNLNKELDSSAFVMVPIDHPKINEIIKLLNNINLSTQERAEEENQLEIQNDFKLIITLNDILTNFRNGKIIIPENSIITPLAKDYIKQKKIEIVYINN
ncbi:MAG: hypothetical protein ACRC92_02920 [Peptostreptococcaceae bacterium]